MGTKTPSNTGSTSGIDYESMTDEEREIAASLGHDPFEAAKDAFALLTIRERRILKRIAKVDFTEAEEIHAKGYNVEWAMDVVTTTKRSTQEAIMRLEEGLNAMAARKAKAIDQIDRDHRGRRGRTRPREGSKKAKGRRAPFFNSWAPGASGARGKGPRSVRLITDRDGIKAPLQAAGDRASHGSPTCG